MSDSSQLLSGVRVIESSLLGPGHLATFFADMGADVIKVEPPAGDYIRQMTWPIVKGVPIRATAGASSRPSITRSSVSCSGTSRGCSTSGARRSISGTRPG